jgi:hypothetical protein
MLHYLFAVGYALFVICAFTGWGSAVELVLFRRTSADWGLRAAWGVACSAVVGGALNLLSMASKPYLIVYAAIGCALGPLAWLRRERPSREKSLESKRGGSARLGISILCTLIAIRCLFSPADRHFNSTDDYFAYFVFPAKMVQTGSLGKDPFSERRLVSSLGGGYYLQGLLLAGLGEQGLNILDEGIGLAIVAALIWGFVRDKNASDVESLIALAVVTFDSPWRVNSTTVVLASGMLVALYRTCNLRAVLEGNPLTGGLLVGLVAAGTASLKMTMISPVGAFLVLHYVWQCLARPRRGPVVARAVLSAVFTLVFLFPWMLDSLRSGGTLLFPLLGLGYHGSAYGKFWMPGQGTTLRNLPHHITGVFTTLLPVIPLMFVVTMVWQRKVLSAVFPLCAAALIASLAVQLATGGIAAPRYSFSFNFAAAIVAIADGLVPQRGRGGQVAAVPILAVLATGLLLGDSFQTLRDNIRPAMLDFDHVIRGQAPTYTLETPVAVSDTILTDSVLEQKPRYLAAQSSIPAGATVLTRLTLPFLLDFRRNQIYVADIPGGASPPPGMPTDEGPEALASYLNKQNIRYVAFSHGNKTFDVPPPPDPSPWIRSEHEFTFEFEENVSALGVTRKRIYDDGDIFVIDLDQPARGGG